MCIRDRVTLVKPVQFQNARSPMWVTLLPMVTGYMAFHRVIDPYPLILGLHILSVELLMVLFPFTKLMHAVTVFPARWYNGAISGFRGVES